MSNVFLLYMPPGNAEAMVYYQDTIKKRVPLSRISPHVSAQLRSNLISIFNALPIAVWGSAGGPKNRANPPAESDIARHFMVSAPSVNQMLRTLEARGFISRGFDPFTGHAAARSIRILVDL